MLRGFPPLPSSVFAGRPNCLAQEVAPWRCEVCDSMQTQMPSVHQASIAHLVSCGHPAPPAPFLLNFANRGYQMLLREGWAESGLGVTEYVRMGGSSL